MRFVRTGIVVTLLAMGACGPAPRTESAPLRPGGSRLILPDAADARQSGSLLDLVRRRLPVVVQSGRFMVDGSITAVCVHARRSGRAVGMSAGRDVATGGPGEALILWTRGRGPYSAHGRLQVSARRPS